MTKEEQLTNDKIIEEANNLVGDIICYISNSLENDDFRELGYAYNTLENFKELLDIIKGRICWKKGEILGS